MNRFAIICAGFILMTASAFAKPLPQWTNAWPDTDFSKSTIDIKDIKSGGPPRDGIPSIDNPRFQSIEADVLIPETEPVISIEINDDARAYPVRILMWHEIVNDTVGEAPVAITYCPLCNASVVFNRKLKDKTLEFGTSGMLRYSDMIMYDRQTDSLWQQFTGEAVIGELTGSELEILPSRTESLALFKARHPDGKVLETPKGSHRLYGINPYKGYDSDKAPFLFDGDYDGPVPPLARVVAVGKDAWPLSTLRKKKTIRHGDLTLKWSAGQNSALDTSEISQGRDIGNVTVTQNGQDAIYHIPFAFAFLAFHPDGTIHTK